MKKITTSGLICLSIILCLYNNGYGQHPVSGTVYEGESQEEVIPGVNVLVKGTTIGTFTDSDGNYSLSAPSPTDTLIFSYVGYEDQQIFIDGRSEIDVSLSEGSESLGEMVVIGYGEQTREEVIGAVSTVSGEQLTQADEGGNLIQSLQGQVPGLTAFTTNAKPGETQTVMQIRAATSMGSNEPLYIVDGVEQQSISNIDPIEVANVSVLKGASATAVYGVKAANGVVVIKTKRGREGEINLNFSSEATVKQPTRLPEFMNAYETLKLRNEGYRNDGRWDDIVSQEVLEHYRVQDMPYIYPDTDWMDFLWEPAIDQKYNLNASGGTDFVQFFASVSYMRQTDIMNTGENELFPYDLDPNYRNNRYNFRNNLDFNITDGTQLSVQLSGNIQDWNRPIDTYTQELMFEPVTALPYYPEEALELYPDDDIPYNQSGLRPYIDPEQGIVRMNWVGGQGVSQRNSTDFNANLVFDQSLDFLTEGLQFTGQYSYQNYEQYFADYNLTQFFGYHLQPNGEWLRYTRVGDLNLNDPQPEINSGGAKQLGAANRSHFYSLQLNYNQSFQDHNVTATGVFNRRQARGIANFPSYEEDWVGRATYNYDTRYFLEGSVSYTGSEKFAPGERFGLFPSVGVGWTPSNESFFEENMPSWFNHFKVKYSWGKIGSDAGIARWLYRTYYQPNVGGISFGDPLQFYNYIGEGDIPLSATWETSTKQNLGIEMGFLNDQITLNVDLYNERREDILQARQDIPTYFGSSSNVFTNAGATKAHGIEVELGINKTFDNGLNLFLDAYGTTFESRVTNWAEPEGLPFHLKRVGKPVGIAQRMNYYTPSTGVQVAGLYQSFDELFMWPLASGSPIVGDHKYLDFDGNGIVNENDRLVQKYPFTPTYNWNATLGFNYKNWTVQASFYGVSNTNFAVRQGGMFFLYPFAQGKDNAMTYWADRWTSSNTNTSVPAVHANAEGHYNQRISSYGILNGKYVRLKRALITYRLQTGGLTNMGINQIAFTLNGTNLWTWTKLPFGGDPEGGNYGGQDFGAYPMQTRFGFKAEVSF